jgi:hypothetical protein
MFVCKVTADTAGGPGLPNWVCFPRLVGVVHFRTHVFLQLIY